MVKYIPQIFSLFILLLVIFFSSCEHEPFPPLIEDPGPSDTVIFVDDPCDEDSVYFENQILPFFISSCAQPGCHDAATGEDGVVLDSYENIMTTGEIIPGDPGDSEVYETITDNDPDDRMPPPPEDPLTSEQIQMIFDWIDQGAQNNSCNSCDTTEVTYNGTILPLIELKCQGCHSGGEPEADLSLISYDDISTIALNGNLMWSVTGTNGATLMPLGGNLLPQCERDQLEIWINDGAPEN
ncbi:MAG: hypothetical protein HKN39_06160 [Flavobacteriales bacterium]|nr:hypothetical protein [Flavobacteriales bacterium]